MRRAGNLKEKFLSFENLYTAYKKARKGTKNYAADKFAFNAERELLALQEELKDEAYIPGDYHYFTIHEPKERQISVADFRDRVVHHALVNVLEPVYEKRFIYDSYANRKGKGTHRAVERAQQFMKKSKWYLKMDVKKYFGSIDHNILNRILERKIKDAFILRLCRKIIEKGGDGAKGLPIGNLTSQFFANVYLDILDHFVKEELRIKHYLRYMDDFCIFSRDKQQLRDLRPAVEDFLKDSLALNLKEKATLLNSSLHGLPFLGRRVFPAMIRMKRENFKYSLNRLKLREWEFRTGKICYNRYHSSVQSITSYINYWNRGLLQNVLHRA